jgi:hypothetical protein
VAEALPCWLRQCPELRVQEANQKHVSLRHADDTKVVLSSLQPELVQSLACAWICLPWHPSNASTLLSPVWCLLAPCHPPILLRWLVSFYGCASKKCLGVTFAPATAQFFEPVGREGLHRQWRQPALGRPTQPSAACDTHLASVELLCSRLLGLDLSVMGQSLGRTGSAAAQVWYHAEFEGISPGHLADLERVLQHTVDGQPPRPDGAATGWLQGSPTVSWQAALQKGASGFWHHGSIWWLGVPVGHQARGRPLSGAAVCPMSSTSTADSLAGTRGAARGRMAYG